MLLLYQKPPRRKAECTAHLHSTMLLLYRTWVSVWLSIWLIYIPLCFYFIGDDESRCVRCWWIYIPLCFYFILRKRSLRQGSFKFTFHYASTLSKKTRQSARYASTFTFHYASTLSEWKRKIRALPIIYIPLCFYFIIDTLSFSEYEKLIYIPLCFYFIEHTCFIKVLQCQFTFHYASTLS